jgi:hypothetical protein
VPYGVQRAPATEYEAGDPEHRRNHVDGDEHAKEQRITGEGGGAPVDRDGPHNDECLLNDRFSLPSDLTVYCRNSPRADMSVKNIILVIVAIAAFFGAIVVAVGPTTSEALFWASRTMQQYR